MFSPIFSRSCPRATRRAEYLLLGNIQPALQRSVREQMNGTRLVGGDTMNYWINDFRDELLADAEGLGFPADQRQRGEAAFGRNNLKKRGHARSWTWARTHW